MLIKSIIKNILPSSLRSKLKKSKRRVYNKLKGNISKTTLTEIRNLLVNDFGIKKGDNLIISSSFGNLNADFTPLELIQLLQNILGKEGNIVMPYYPPGNSDEWAKKGETFDMGKTKSSMGVLTQCFSELPNVHKSKHPTKAIVAWGANAQEIVSNHEIAKTPFYWDSPYGWLLKHESKSIGLGLKNIPIFHSLEDIILENELNLYQNKIYNLKVRDYSQEIITMKTLVHDPAKIAKLIDAGDYVRSLELPSYNKEDFGYSFCYSVNNQELFEKCSIEFKTNNFRDKK